MTSSHTIQRQLEIMEARGELIFERPGLVRIQIPRRYVVTPELENAAEPISKISPAMDELMSDYFDNLQWPRSVGLCVLCGGGIMETEA